MLRFEKVNSFLNSVVFGSVPVRGNAGGETAELAWLLGPNPPAVLIMQHSVAPNGASQSRITSARRGSPYSGRGCRALRAATRCKRFVALLTLSCRGRLKVPFVYVLA